MQWISPESLAKQAPEIWKSRYGRGCQVGDRWFQWRTAEAEEIYNRLLSLRENDQLTPAKVEAVLGASFAICNTICDECGRENIPVVVFGEPSCEHEATYVCADCMTEALKEIPS